MTTRNVDQWLITAPQGTFEAVLSVVVERSTQEAKGWDPEHDDDHGPEYLRLIAKTYLDSAQGDSQHQRQHRRDRLVKAAASIVAAIEVLDRHEIGTSWPLPQSQDSQS